MEKFDFIPSEDLGIKADDPAFMERFDSSLSLERRPLRKTRRWDLRLFAEALGWALAAAALVWLLEPLALAFLEDAGSFLDQAGAADSSFALLLALSFATVGLALSLWPRLIEDLDSDVLE